MSTVFHEALIIMHSVKYGFLFFRAKTVFLTFAAAALFSDKLYRVNYRNGSNGETDRSTEKTYRFRCFSRKIYQFYVTRHGVKNLIGSHTQFPFLPISTACAIPGTVSPCNELNGDISAPVPINRTLSVSPSAIFL